MKFSSRSLIDGQKENETKSNKTTLKIDRDYIYISLQNGIKILFFRNPLLLN